MLSDSEFDADWAARLPFQFDPQGRNDLLGRLVRGHRVMHIGFADHGPLIETKRAQGVWLHDRVMREAALAVGLDINAQSVDMARKLGVPNLYAQDVHGPEMDKLMRDHQPDLWLMPDVLEHLHEPVGFLKRLAELGPELGLVISVPNGLSFRNTINAVRGVERINTDHLCWYSPFTSLKLPRRAGYVARGLWSCQIAPPGSWRGHATSAILARRPIWADNLVVVAYPETTVL